MDIAKPIEALSNAKGFKANMIATILIVWLGYMLISELITQTWIKDEPILQKAVVASVVLLIFSIVIVTMRWLRTVRETKLKHVFVAFPSMENEPFHVEVLRGITEELSSQYTVTLWLPQHGGKYMGSAFEGFLRKIKSDSAQYIGGIVLPTEVDHKNPEDLSKIMQEIGLPIIIVDTLPKAFLEDGLLRPGQQFIGFNNIQGGSLAAKAMYEELKNINVSDKNILVLHAKEQHDRHESFINEITNLLPDVEIELEECGWDRNVARKKVKDRIKHGALKNCCGIFGCNDEMAIGAIEAIAECDFDSRDLVIIGYDGSPSAKTLLSVGNTALKNYVVQDGYKLGVEAAERLIQASSIARVTEPGNPEYLDTELEKRYFNI